jgi:RND family efflux transporter MFP subunit
MFKPHARNPRVAASLALAVALSLALAACTEGKSENKSENKSEAAAKPAALRAVVAQPVSFEPRTATRSFVGVVRPRVESDLGFRVGGKVAERLVQAGDRVKAGQALASLDTVDLKLQLEQAQAELTAARASLLSVEQEDRRIGQLRSEGWSTASAAEKQKAAVEEARGRRNRAERAVSLATNSFDYATLRADADGIVTATLVEPGQVVAQGIPAIRLAKVDSREAVAAIPEALIERVRTAKAQVSLWSEPGKSYQAKLRELSPSADPATRTYQARFTILDAPTTLEFGLTATVTLSDPESEKVARLPLSSLFNQGQGTSVFVVNPSTGALVLKPVEVLAYESTDVVLRSGVVAGDMVVTLGVQKLDVAQRVRIVQR